MERCPRCSSVRRRRGAWRSSFRSSPSFFPLLPDGISGTSGQMWHLEDLYVGIIQSENLRVSEPWKIHQTPRPISQWVLGELPRMIYRSRGNRVNLKFSSMDYWFDPSFNADYWRKGTGQNWPKSLYFTRRTTHKNDRISQNVDELELCDYSADFNEWWLVLKITSRPFVILWWFWIWE